jgi:bifunctional enzyme CysN/CysC
MTVLARDPRDRRPAAAVDDTSARTEGRERTLLRFITCGSVDDGKSTLIGRLLYEAGAVYDDQLAELEGDSRRFGTQGAAPDFALLVDGLSAEREQGITIDVAHRYFRTDRRAFIVADTPGHEQYTRNMATGASTADLAVLLVDARKGLLAQTRRHAFIVSLVGVRHVVVAVNKMDLVGFDRATFAAIEADLRAATAGLGFSDVTVIPVSARDGDNVTRRSPHMAWYDGPALLPFLEQIETGVADDPAAGLLLPVQWVNRPNAEFRGYCGLVARGVARPGRPVVVLPSGRTSRIARVLAPDHDVAAAGAGRSVTLTLTDDIDVARGDVLASPEAVAPPSRTVVARLLWTGTRPLLPGADLLVKLAGHVGGATVTALHHVVDITTYAARPAERLAMNGIGLATLKFDREVVALPYAESPALGGFILIDRASNETVAFGFVTDAAAVDERPPARHRSAEGRFGMATAIGRRGAERLSRHLSAAASIGLVAFAASGQPQAGIWTALAVLLLRSPARNLHRRIWTALRRSSAERPAG